MNWLDQGQDLGPTTDVDSYPILSTIYIYLDIIPSV